MEWGIQNDGQTMFYFYGVLIGLLGIGVVGTWVLSQMRSQNRLGKRNFRKPLVKRSGNQWLDDLERAHIRNVLENTNGVIEGPKGAAATLHLKPQTVRRRMQILGIKNMT